MSPTAEQQRPGQGRPAGVRLWATAAVLALFAAGMWFAWLGWDHQYYDVGGVPQGPYRAWQVVGCAVAVAGAAVLAQLWVGEQVGIVVLAAAAVIGFAVPWSVDAAGSDETGMWGVGLVMLVAGGGVGLVVVLAITEAVARPGLPPTFALVVLCGLTLATLLAFPLGAVVPLLLAAWVLVRRCLPQWRGARSTP